MKLRHGMWALLAAAAMIFLPASVRAEEVYLQVEEGQDIAVELFQAAEGGNTVIIPEGSYELGSKVRIGSDTTIKSASGKVTLRMSDDSDVMLFTESGEDTTNITLQDLILQGEMNSADILRFYDVNKLKLNRVQIRNSGGVGVRFIGCIATVMNNCIVNGNYTEGIAVEDSTVMIKKTTISENGHKVSGHLDYNSEGNGISVRKGAVVSFKASTMEKNMAYGIGVSGGGFIKLQGTKKAPNKVTANNWKGISVTGKGSKASVNYLNCDGNGVDPARTAVGTAGHGMGVSGGATATVKNSTFNNNAVCGLVLIKYGSKLTITKCKLNKNGGYGLRANSGVTLTLTSCTANHNGEHGVMMLDKSGGTLTSLTASYNGEGCKGLVVGKTNKKVTITGGKFVANGQDGISLYEITGKVRVTGATMKKNPWFGLRILNCPKAVVKKCKYSGNGRGTYTLTK